VFSNTPTEQINTAVKHISCSLKLVWSNLLCGPFIAELQPIQVPHSSQLMIIFISHSTLWNFWSRNSVVIYF